MPSTNTIFDWNLWFVPISAHAGAHCTKMAPVMVKENVLLLPPLDNVVKGNTILVLFFQFSKTAKLIFTTLLVTRAHSDGRPGGRSRIKTSVTHHMLFCSFVWGPNDKIKIPACPKMINLLHSVKNLQCVKNYRDINQERRLNRGAYYVSRCIWTICN